MGFEEIRKAHEKELAETGKIPNACILGDRLIAARDRYFGLQDSYVGLVQKMVESGNDDRLKCSVAFVAGKVAGAEEVLKALGFKFDGKE